jgi:hypothetical protein
VGDVAVALTRRQLAWRFAAAAVGVVLVAHGSIWGDDQQWPFAPMSQFAFAVSPEGDIKSNYVEADTTAGTTVRVPLDAAGVGLGRAEVEGQLGRFVTDPALLGSIAEAAANLHPEWPHYVRLRLLQQVTLLDDGKVGATYIRQLAAYDMPPGRLGSRR